MECGVGGHGRRRSFVFDEDGRPVRPAVAMELDEAGELGHFADDTGEGIDAGMGMVFAAFEHVACDAHGEIAVGDWQQEEEPHAEDQSEKGDERRHDGGPHEGGSQLRTVEAQRRPAVEVVKLRQGVAAAFHAAPPLDRAGHRGVVQSHFVIEADDPVASEADAGSEVGLFAGDERLAVAVHASEDVGAHHAVAAELARIADRRGPLDVTEQVEDSCVGEALAPPATHDGDIAVVMKVLECVCGPAWIDGAITINELQESHIGGQLEQALGAGIAGAGGGEALGHIELDDIGAGIAGKLNGVVG